jgi:hypothetical protein
MTRVTVMALFFLSAALTFILFEFIAMAEIIDLSTLYEIRSLGLSVRVDRARITGELC